MVRRGNSPRTVTKRINLLRRWISFVGDPFTAGSADVLAWLDTTTQQPDSMAQTVSCLHAFYVWAIRSELTDADPTLRVDRPKTKQRLPRPMPERDYRMAATVIDHPVVRAWILLAGQCGLRCVELGRLRWSDLDLERCRARVHGKGDRERIVGLPPIVVAHLSDMPHLGPYLNGERAASGASVSTRGNNALRAIGVRSTMHQLRHRAATEAYRATHDLRVVQRMMGHASSVTTELYTAIEDDEVLAASLAIPAPGLGGSGVGSREAPRPWVDPRGD
jgi:integrase